MSRIARAAALGLVLIAPAALAQSGDDRPDRGGKIAWRQDHDQAFADAARTGEPIVVYFTADW